MMRKVLSSSNALMIGVLALLLAFALWTVFGGDEEPTGASGIAEDQSARQTQTARGGGPIEEGDETSDEASPQLDAPDLEGDQDDEAPQLEDPQLDQPQLEAPPLEQPTLQPPPSQEPEASSDREQAPGARESETEANGGEGDQVDQEAAFSQDDAPEAEVIGVQPADSEQSRDREIESREGGGPIEETGEETSEERRGETDDRPGEGASAGEREAVDENEPDVQQGNELPSGDPATETLRELETDGEASSDESRIERPGLRSAPRPSRPGEDAE